MANKTKSQLEQEIKDLKSQLGSVSKDEQNDKAAQELRSAYESYIRAGFTEEQAWTLVITIVSNYTQQKVYF